MEGGQAGHNMRPLTLKDHSGWLLRKRLREAKCGSSKVTDGAAGILQASQDGSRDGDGGAASTAVVEPLCPTPGINVPSLTEERRADGKKRSELFGATVQLRAERRGTEEARTP